MKKNLNMLTNLQVAFVGFIMKVLYYIGTLGGWWGNLPVVKRV